MVLVVNWVSRHNRVCTACENQNWGRNKSVNTKMGDWSLLSTIMAGSPLLDGVIVMASASAFGVRFDVVL